MVPEQVPWSLPYYFILHFPIHLLPSSQAGQLRSCHQREIPPFLLLIYTLPSLIKIQWWHNDVIQMRSVPASLGACIGRCRVRAFVILKIRRQMNLLACPCRQQQHSWLGSCGQNSLEKPLALVQFSNEGAERHR